MKSISVVDLPDLTQQIFKNLHKSLRDLLQLKLCLYYDEYDQRDANANRKQESWLVDFVKLVPSLEELSLTFEGPGRSSRSIAPHTHGFHVLSQHQMPKLSRLELRNVALICSDLFSLIVEHERTLRELRLHWIDTIREYAPIQGRWKDLIDDWRHRSSLLELVDLAWLHEDGKIACFADVIPIECLPCQDSDLEEFVLPTCGHIRWISHEGKMSDHFRMEPVSSFGRTYLT